MRPALASVEALVRAPLRVREHQGAPGPQPPGGAPHQASFVGSPPASADGELEQVARGVQAPSTARPPPSLTSTRSARTRCSTTSEADTPRGADSARRDLRPGRRPAPAASALVLAGRPGVEKGRARAARTGSMAREEPVSTPADDPGNRVRWPKERVHRQPPRSAAPPNLRPAGLAVSRPSPPGDGGRGPVCLDRSTNTCHVKLVDG